MEKKILRVFPHKTSYTPDEKDPYVYVANGLCQVPALALFPEFDAAHMKCGTDFREFNT